MDCPLLVGFMVECVWLFTFELIILVFDSLLVGWLFGCLFGFVVVLWCVLLGWF